MSHIRMKRILFILILLSYIGMGTLFAWRVPAWQAPDEPAHYNYIAQIVDGNILPVIEMGDWDNAYLNTLKARDFAPELLSEFDTIQYEDHQPPLYYWLAAPVFWLTNGNLFAIRMVSVLLGAVIVSLSYFISRALLPNQPFVALCVMLLVGFLPQNLHILASVNNDALAGVIGATLLWMIVRHLDGTPIPLTAFGVMMGLGFITKTTIYFMIAVILLAIILRWQRNDQNGYQRLLQQSLTVILVSTMVAVPYWARNLWVYGLPDFLGLIAHNDVVIGQLRRQDHIQAVGFSAYWYEAFTTTFHSFWGQFGWMEARLSDAMPWAMGVIIALNGIGLSGFFLFCWNQIRRQGNDSPFTSQLLCLGSVILLAGAQYIYYNLTFVQFQGRYLFVAIIPIALVLVIGVNRWRDSISLTRYTGWLMLGIFAFFPLLDMYLIWRVIPCALGC